ncbi:MAG TPA: hypothetical protein VK983_05830, partial [Candidatus Limnocylindrales bacterium]|nr:hypothetical protein [Candidatus Limnocylindrales bacterium]
MKREKIAFDLDDVLANSTDSLRLVVNERMGVGLKREDYLVPGDYSQYYERVWKRHGVVVSFDDLFQEMEVDQMHVPVYEGAQETLD